MSDELFEAIESCSACFVYEGDIGGDFSLCPIHDEQFNKELDDELAKRAASG